MLRWPWELTAQQLKKTHAKRQNTRCFFINLTTHAQHLEKDHNTKHIRKRHRKDHNIKHQKKAMQIDRNTMEVFPEDTCCWRRHATLFISFSNTSDGKRTLIALWLKIWVNNKRVQTCALFSVLWKQKKREKKFPLKKRLLCCGVFALLCVALLSLQRVFLMRCIVVFAEHFLNAAHVLSDWWRCFLNLLVFCLLQVFS